MKKMKSNKWYKIKQIGSVVFLMASILSTLLMFVFPLWIMMIINAGEIVLYRALFRGVGFSFRTSVAMYIVAGVLLVGIMAAILVFPAKICEGTMANISDKEYVMHNLARSFADKSMLTPEAATRYYYIRMGVTTGLLFIAYLAVGGYLLYSAEYDSSILLPFYAVNVISIAGGMMLLNLQNVPLSAMIVFTVLYVVGVFFINALYTYLTREATDPLSGRGRRGSRGEYEVTITVKKK